MLELLLGSTNFLNQCQFNISFLNEDGWIGICMLVVMTSLLISAVGYSLSSFLPGSQRERLRGIVRYEYIQGIFSIILIVVLFSMSLGACDLGGALTYSASGYQDPFQFAQYYVGNLLFSKGIALVTGLFSAGTVLAIDAAISSYTASAIGNLFPEGAPKQVGILGSTLKYVPTLQITGTDQPAEILYEYSYVLYYLLAPLVVVTFGLLFVAFLSLPAIEALSLTLVIPIAIIMRSLAFTGPKLREVSNTLIALAIAFYFVLPLTFAMNYYVVNWVYCLNGGTCNPYVAYLGAGGYNLNTLPINQLLASPDLLTTQGTPNFGAITLPGNFYGYGVLQGNGGFGNMMSEVIQGLANVPGFLNNFDTETAQYLFQGIFLVGLDAAITIGFAVGLSKGLETLGQLMGVGPFWSG